MANVKTWQDRVPAYNVKLEDTLNAKDAEIADLRAALSAQEPVQPEPMQVGVVVRDDPVHGWHMKPLVPWTVMGEGAKLYTRPLSPVAGEVGMSDPQIIELWAAQRQYHGGEPCKLAHLEFARAILEAAWAK